MELFDVTRFNRSNEELERFMLLALAVSGKKAIIQEPKVLELIEKNKINNGVLSYLNLFTKEEIIEKLKEVKLGQYNRIASAIIKLKSNNLHTIDVNILSEIVGYKTARFFVLHSRANQKLICLDTHLLKFFNNAGLTKFNYNNRPNKKQYLELENELVSNLESRGITNFASFDFAVWKSYATKDYSLRECYT